MESDARQEGVGDSRRQFLKKAALGGAVAGFAGAGQAAPGKDSTRGHKGKTFELVRRIPVHSGYDVVVAGGGPSGVAAAVSAARLGARVLLCEGTGCLGGMGSSGLVSAFDPMANGKEQLVRGFMAEVVEMMYQERIHELRSGVMARPISRLVEIQPLKATS